MEEDGADEEGARFSTIDVGVSSVSRSMGWTPLDTVDIEEVALAMELIIGVCMTGITGGSSVDGRPRVASKDVTVGAEVNGVMVGVNPTGQPLSSVYSTDCPICSSLF